MYNNEKLNKVIDSPLYVALSTGLPRQVRMMLLCALRQEFLENTDIDFSEVDAEKAGLYGDTVLGFDFWYVTVNGLHKTYR